MNPYASKTLIELGDFEVTSPALILSDPGYEKHLLGHNTLIKKVQMGLS